uniref:Uncharacterized protein n=1 Tax=Arundo donax TaxID=35708 RepID=A0A0A9DZ69_ARUDO
MAAAPQAAPAALRAKAGQGGTRRAVASLSSPLPAFVALDGLNEASMVEAVVPGCAVAASVVPGCTKRGGNGIFSGGRVVQHRWLPSSPPSSRLPHRPVQRLEDLPVARAQPAAGIHVRPGDGRAHPPGPTSPTTAR